ncbi:MAG: hypothetical protein LBU12_05145, partial [Deltaproteobacteria bacterium]|nr:hypothetical protein [Deltaproteobacteria bacterium]
MSRAASFQTVKVEGAVLPESFLRRLIDNDGEIEGLSSDDYRLYGSLRPNEAAARAWNNLQGAWSVFRTSMETLQATNPGTTLTREKWLRPLFAELGYGLLPPVLKPLELGGKKFPVSHFWQNTPIHQVSFRQELDKRTSPCSSKLSPHNLVQDLLSRSDDFLWGVATNGLSLRLLRD